VFEAIVSFLLDCSNAVNEDLDINYSENYKLLVTEKTRIRVKDYIKQSSKNFNLPTSLNGVGLPSVNYIINDCLSKIDENNCLTGVLHGDLCFSNILYDTRSDRIKVIDPRGLDHSNNFMYIGDLRYDISKLNHSIFGLYDYIISGAYNLHEYDDFNYDFEILVDERIDNIQELYIDKMRFPNISALELMPETVLLFFSMLPLHSDNPDRQNAFIANAIRLYSKYIYK
jgi:hypothetical protein